jgi:exonuclease SbcD
MTFRFMHAADIHLDSPLRGLEQYEDAPVAEIRGATRGAFTRLVTECIEQGVSFLLIVGDLYDGDSKDYKTALFFVEQMNRLREQGIGAYVVMGNHDAASVVSKSLRVPDTVKIFRSTEAHTFEIESLKVALHGQSYARVDVSDDLSAHYPAPVAGAFNIGLLHTSADGAASEHAPYAPCSLQGLVDRGYQYWALGHVHRRRVLHDDPPVLFPGNLQGRNVRETGARGATLVTVDDNQRVHCEHRDLDVMRWFVREVSVEGADNATAAVDRVHASLVALRRDEPHRPLAVRIRLVGQCAAHGELVGAVEKWTHEVRAPRLRGRRGVDREGAVRDAHPDRSRRPPPAARRARHATAEPRPRSQRPGRTGGTGGGPRPAAGQAGGARGRRPGVRPARGHPRPARRRRAVPRAHAARPGGEAMRFVRLDLLAFGHFTRRALDFPIGGANFHLIHGSNEAGKSTTLRAISGLLYGIERLSTDAFLHEPGELRVGGRLQHSSGLERTFVRRKGTNATLSDEHGNPHDDADLQAWLSVQDRRQFEAMFGLGHEQLRRAGEALATSKTAVGEALFGAVLDGAALKTAMAQLEAAAEEILTPAGRAGSLVRALAQHREARKRQREHELPPAKWKELQQAILAEEKRRGDLVKEINQLRADRHRLDRTKQVLPVLGQRASAISARAAMGEVRLLALDAGERREELTRALRAADEALEELSAKIDLGRRARDVLEVPEAVVGATSRITQLTKDFGTYQKAQSDLGGVIKEIVTHKQREEEILRELGMRGMAVSEVGQLAVDEAAVAPHPRARKGRHRAAHETRATPRRSRRGGRERPGLPRGARVTAAGPGGRRPPGDARTLSGPRPRGPRPLLPRPR